MQLRVFLPVAGLIVLATLAPVLAQPRMENRVERWNDMPMNQLNNGMFGNSGPQSVGAATDPCPPNPWAPPCELPAGSGQHYLFQAGLWVGALIVEEGFETPRVSISADGWSCPAIAELWSSTGFVERSTLDTVNCFNQGIASEAAIADHEYECVFTDTLTNPIYVEPDPIDDEHRPLGIQVTRTTYAMQSEACNHITWIKYRIENIGSNYLKNLYLGLYVDGDAWHGIHNDQNQDDLIGYDPVSELAYSIDNDGRAVGDSTGNDFTTPHALGFGYLAVMDGDGNAWGPLSGQHLSFNWWISSDDTARDFGPAWEAYAVRDSLGLGWTRTYGTPVGDERRYRLMSNWEIDYDMVRAGNREWINSHPPEGTRWYHPNPAPDVYAADIGNGMDARYLFSVGPCGIYDYTDAAGRHICRLNPGESFDVWAAWVGGLDFHNASRPQLMSSVIDPSRFDLTDLRTKAALARQQTCLEWDPLPVGEPPQTAPDGFSLSPVYPNPFNATTRVRFTLPQTADVTIRVVDLLGRVTHTLAQRRFSAGSHEMTWDARRLPSGTYFVKAQAGNGALLTQKAVLLK